MTRLHLTALVVIVASLSFVGRAHAGGLFLYDRGVRPLSRGGAFVAAPDDPHALSYNPAGIALAGDQILVDATLTLMSASVRRTLPDGTLLQRVEAQNVPLPIPTLAATFDLGLKDFAFGLGILAPNVPLLRYPRSLPDGQGGNAPTPTRYSLVNLDGSALANLAFGVAYRGIEGLALGIDVQVAAGRFKAETALSACDGFVCTNPEDASFDAYATADFVPAYGVTAAAGVSYAVSDGWRLGASFTAPYKLRGTGTLNLRLPSAALFDQTEVVGDEATLTMDFPAILRAGSEIRPLSFLRMEAAFVWEQWSRQQTIDLAPQDVRLRNVVGIGDYDVGPVALQRNMRDTWSLRGGFELSVPADWLGARLQNLGLTLRGGVGFERGAFADQALSPMTLDSDKFVLSGGLGVNLARRLRFDAAAGWYRLFDRQVRDSQIRQPAAIRPPSEVTRSVIGNGDYRMEAFFLGGGFTIAMDDRTASQR